MKKFIAVICVAALISVTFFSVGCSKLSGIGEASKYEKIVYAMDTIMQLDIYSTDPEISQKAEDEIMRLDKMLDRGDQESEIYEMNHAEKAVTVSDEIVEIISMARDVSVKSGGAFDITIAPVMDAWGFYSKNYHVPSDDELDVLLEKVDYSKILLEENTVTVPDGMELDLGGIAKGYTSDRLMELFQREGVHSAIVSLGGNVQALGRKPDGSLWNVAIQDPGKPDSYIGSLSIENMAVVTSGSYQRYFERDGVTYHHIIDPSEGRPADNGLSSVTIITESGMLGDVLSTALFVLGLDDAVDYWHTYGGFQAVFVDNNGKIYITAGLENSFKCERSYEIIQ
ncbi:MAG: FAD:protein FMN transferase [Monoglobales bacterium]